MNSLLVEDETALTHMHTNTVVATVQLNTHTGSSSKGHNHDLMAQFDIFRATPHALTILNAHTTSVQILHNAASLSKFDLCLRVAHPAPDW